MNAAKRDAFFRSGSDGPTTKFDPTARFDRERTKQDKDKDKDHQRDNESEKEKEKGSLKKFGDTYRHLDGYVGFANLPNQVYRKSVKRGFEFTLMVVG